MWDKLDFEVFEGQLNGIDQETAFEFPQGDAGLRQWVLICLVLRSSFYA